MTLNDDALFLLIHPRAPARHPKRFKELLRLLESSGRPFERAVSRDAEDLTRLCRQALEKGYRRIASVGGDGTLHLCARAFMEKDRNLFPDAALLPLPFGTGNDFYAGIIPVAARKNLTWITAPLQTHMLDLGRFQDIHGREIYFLNTFSTGLTSAIIRDYERSSLRSYLASTLRSLINHRSEDLRVRFEGAESTKNTILFIICKGEFVGAGMRLHREASHHTGRSEVIWIPKVGAGTILKNLPRIYKGGLESVPDVTNFSFRNLELEWMNQDHKTVLVEADGELHEVPRRLELRLLPRRLGILGPRLP